MEAALRGAYGQNFIDVQKKYVAFGIGDHADFNGNGGKAGVDLRKKGAGPGFGENGSPAPEVFLDDQGISGNDHSGGMDKVPAYDDEFLFFVVLYAGGKALQHGEDFVRLNTGKEAGFF